MATWTEVLQEALTLTKSVSELRQSVVALTKRVEENRERIVRLEAREDVLAERIARQASEAVAKMHIQHSERVTRVELKAEQLDGRHLSPPE